MAGVIPRPDLYRGAAALKLTSGSTGLPKATFTTDEELAVDTDQILGAMDIRPEHTQLAAIPLSHAYGLGNLLVPALTRGTAVILREGFVPHSLFSDARAYGADAFPGVPFMFEHLAGAPPGGGWPPRLRKLDQCRRPARTSDRAPVLRDVRRQDPLVLRHERGWWNCLRRRGGPERRNDGRTATVWRVGHVEAGGRRSAGRRACARGRGGGGCALCRRESVRRIVRRRRVPDRRLRPVRR